MRAAKPRPLNAKERETVAANLRLVGHMVGTFLKAVPQAESFKEDLFQEGVFALTRAVRQHRAERGTLSTIAGVALWRHFTLFYGNCYPGVRVPIYEGRKADPPRVISIGNCDLEGDAPTPAAVSEHTDDLDRLRAELDALPERERIVMKGRYGIGGAFKTLNQLGEELSLTRERVRQIQREVEAKLRIVLNKESACSV